jgi:hypothetical protein
VSRDGIVLWSRLHDRDGPTASVETTAIVRRPVDPDEVRPPDDLLDLRHWMELAERIAAPARAPVPLADYEAVLATAQAPDGNAGFVRTTRRHRFWTAVESRPGNGSRHVWSYNERTKLSISFETNAAGDAATLVINVPLRAENDADREARQRATQAGGQEIMVGEQCGWSSLSSHSGDMVFAQCQDRRWDCAQGEVPLGRPRPRTRSHQAAAAGTRTSRRASARGRVSARDVGFAAVTD